MSLENLFDELRDLEVSDPVCMDKVLTYYDEIIRESDDYMRILAGKLSHAIITWHQPWYQEIPTIKGKKLVNTDGLPQFLEDTINSDESELIKKNWDKLVRKFKIPDRIECFARWKNFQKKLTSEEENVRRFVNAYLARGLKRNIAQVYQHILNRYAHPPKAQYTIDEEKVMDICFYHDPKHAVKISSVVLNRGPRGVLTRFHGTIKGKPAVSRIRWNLDLATKLLKLLMKYTDESLEGLKNKHIKIDTWRELEKDFETQAYYLRYFWYNSLHCQLFVKYDVTLRRVRRRVFKVLRTLPYRYWTDIRWKEVVAEFPDGFTFQFLYQHTIRIFRKTKIHIKLPMQEIVRIGLESTTRLSYGNKRLKTLILNDKGNLEVKRYYNKL